jgi:methylmalonyl-CoA mutase N-terminal domain/subunit
VIAGINRGYFRRAIAEASYRFSEECEAHDRIIVGVNAFTEGSEDRPIEILQISHAVETDQCDQLAQFKAKRNAAEVKAALDRIRETCRNGDPGSKGKNGYPQAAGALGLDKHNVMPSLVNAALHNCTLGEMVQAMADVYGRYSGGPEW